MPNPAAVAADAILDALTDRKGFRHIIDSMEDDEVRALHVEITNCIEHAFWGKHA